MATLENYDQTIAGVPLVRDVFIETGTYLGRTLELAKEHFRECHSIEVIEERYKNCVAKFKNDPHVHLHLGFSQEVLPKIIDPQRETTFWLDGHFEGDDPSMVESMGGECPLMQELEIIVNFEWQSFPMIIIDDCWMYKHDSVYWRDGWLDKWDKSQWPSLEQIQQVLSDYTFVEKDFIFYFVRQGG
jgi:hypothetical protein